MINRENWQEVQAFLKYQSEVKQVESLTARSQWCRLRHLLESAEERQLHASTDYPANVSDLPGRT